MTSFQGKTAFITGSSAGIGLATAKALANAGCHVALFARNAGPLQSAAQEVQQYAALKSIKVTYHIVDMTGYEAVQSAFREALSEHELPDLLINCVGIAQPDYFENISPDQFEKTIRTNLYSTWNSVHVLLPYLKQKKAAHIVNTSSIAGFLGVFGYTDYCMTKFGLIGFSDALRQELAQFNISVSVLCPPDTDTPGFESENKNKPEETKAIGGKAKLLRPEEVAAALLKGIQRKDKWIIPGTEGKLTRWLKRLFPGLLDWIMMDSVRKVQGKKNA